MFLGQPLGALLHAVSRPGGRSQLPAAREGGEDSREQAGTGAEAEHRVPVLVPLGAPGALPPPAAGQALHPHHAAHGHRRPDR